MGVELAITGLLLPDYVPKHFCHCLRPYVLMILVKPSKSKKSNVPLTGVSIKIPNYQNRQVGRAFLKKYGLRKDREMDARFHTEMKIKNQSPCATHKSQTLFNYFYIFTLQPAIFSL